MEEIGQKASGLVTLSGLCLVNFTGLLLARVKKVLLRLFLPIFCVHAVNYQT